MRLNFVALLEGWRRFALLARTAFAGLRSLLVPRLGLFRLLVDRMRKLWLPRLVNLDPSIAVEPVAALLDGRVPLAAGLPALMTLDRREIVIVQSGHRLSPYRKDQLDDWLEGRSRPTGAETAALLTT